MKKKTVIAVVAILILTISCFVACNDGEITSLSVIYENVNLSVGQIVDLNDCIIK